MADIIIKSDIIAEVKGTKSITSNGTDIDVRNFVSADVAVEPALEEYETTIDFSTQTENIVVDTSDLTEGKVGFSKVTIKPQQ